MPYTLGMSETFVACYDLHYPKVNLGSWRAMLDFMSRNTVHGFVFGGDQFDNQCISHHTRGRPLLRDKGGFRRDTAGFEANIMGPLDKLLGKAKSKVWIVGNHDFWERELVEQQPELDGVTDRVELLRLKGRGWQVVENGRSWRHGKLTFIHGDQLTGFGNQVSSYHAKKAVEGYCGNVLYGHVHSPQMFTKVLPSNRLQKWAAWCSPITGNTNPAYLRNRPTSWLNGFTIIEFSGEGDFNCYPVITTNGVFRYGGTTYGNGKRS